MLARVRGESRSKGEQPPITAKVEAESVYKRPDLEPVISTHDYDVSNDFSRT
jgi:hypothetical protein